MVKLIKRLLTGVFAISLVAITGGVLEKISGADSMILGVNDIKIISEAYAHRYDFDGDGYADEHRHEYVAEERVSDRNSDRSGDWERRRDWDNDNRSSRDRNIDAAHQFLDLIGR